MTFQGDPFRTLGVPPGASLNEVRSAYRRLAKQFHPDTAGERALPRFLAIKAAYEALVDDEGRLRGPAGGGTAAGPGRRSQADADRASATRAAYRARRRPAGGDAAAGSGARGWASRPAPGGRRRQDSPGPEAPGTGSPGAGSRRDGGPEPRETRRRSPRKGTPGSTTYDGAHQEPFDPAWEGAGWYGPTLGTYWTINPREYADPRKHGPEYLARARRASATGGDAPSAAPGTPARSDAEPAQPETDASDDRAEATWRWAGTPADAPGGRTAPGPGVWSAHGWAYGDGAARPRDQGRPRPAAATATGRRAASREAASPGSASPDPSESLSASLEALVREAAPDRLRRRAARSRLARIAIALLAWPPIGATAASAIDVLTGCAGSAAACVEPASLLPVAVQPLLVAVLLALPALAAAGAFASLAALAILVPTTVALSASGVDDGDAGARVLVGLVAPIAYLGGWLGALALGRRERGVDGGSR